MSVTSSLRPVRCAIHVHSDYEDGDRPVAEIVAEARAAGVDALLLTDHHAAHAAAAGWEDWHDGILVVVGVEYSTRRHHLLGFGIHDKVVTRTRPTEEVVALLERLGATVFAPHPQGHRSMLTFRRKHIWDAWDLPHYRGLEIWGYLHDWVEHVRPWRLKRMVEAPDDFIRGPEPEVLRQWDALARVRHVAGIGGIDNHARDLPFGFRHLFGWAREGILPHRHCFAAFSTYALCPPFEGEARYDAPKVIDALAAGRAWVVHEALGDGRGFACWGEDRHGRFEMGEERPFLPGATLRLRSPETADLRILNRGEVVARNEGRELDLSPEEPGEYRAELRRDGRVWILGNHLYLRAENDSSASS